MCFAALVVFSYVPNHTSYLDILTLSGFVPRPFKYISKIEILRYDAPPPSQCGHSKGTGIG
jgi:hypothetical protein